MTLSGSSADVAPALDGSPAPTLATGVDHARLATDIAPAVADTIRNIPAALLTPLGFTSPSDVDAIQMGRPYAVFIVHKGPWLEFTGTWRVPVLVRGDYRSIANVKRKEDGYVLVDLGSTSLASMLAAQEKDAAVSAALDQGRAGLLQTVGAGGVSWLAYELAPSDATLPPDIRVRTLGLASESTLAELDKMLPAE